MPGFRDGSEKSLLNLVTGLHAYASRRALAIDWAGPKEDASQQYPQGTSKFQKIGMGTDQDMSMHSKTGTHTHKTKTKINKKTDV